MLDKLEKLEEKVNEGIEKLKALLIVLFYKLVPNKVFEFTNNTKAKILAFLLLFGTLIVLTEGTAIAPFIYALF